MPTSNYQTGNFGAPFVNSAGVTTSIGTTPTCTVISAACPVIGGLTYATQGGVIARDGAGALIPEYGVYDPSTARQSATGVVNSLFPNGVIPANRLDPVALEASVPFAPAEHQQSDQQFPGSQLLQPQSHPQLVLQDWTNRSALPLKYPDTSRNLHQTNPNYNGLSHRGVGCRQQRDHRRGAPERHQ